MGTSLGSYRQGLSAYGPLEHTPSKPPIPNQRQAGSSFSTPNFGNRERGEGLNENNNAYTPSNQGAVILKGGKSPSPAPSNSAPQSQASSIVLNNSVLPLSLPNEQPRMALTSAQQQENIAHRPPSGKQNRSNIKRENMQPPMLPRDGPPGTYKELLNLHQVYQGRNGHLNVPVGTSAVSAHTGSTGAYLQANSQDTSWTVGGVLREQRLNAPMSNKYYNSTRLW